MKEFNSTSLLTASNVANELGVSVKTLTTWYKWYNDPSIHKPDNCPELPCYIQDSPRGKRLWDEGCLYQLKLFRDWVPKGRNGLMGTVNKQYWSKTYKGE